MAVRTDMGPSRQKITAVHFHPDRVTTVIPPGRHQPPNGSHGLHIVPSQSVLHRAAKVTFLRCKTNHITPDETLKADGTCLPASSFTRSPTAGGLQPATGASIHPVRPPLGLFAGYSFLGILSLQISLNCFLCIIQTSTPTPPPQKRPLYLNQLSSCSLPHYCFHFLHGIA